MEESSLHTNKGNSATSKEFEYNERSDKIMYTEGRYISGEKQNYSEISENEWLTGKSVWLWHTSKSVKGFSVQIQEAAI
jgi:hypothetical protein